MRGQKRYDEAVDYYTRAIALIDRPEEKHWTFYYSRGTCYERVKKLSLAEADLQKALQLSPNQALTLNYLGYTWIDHNRNLQQGLGLIKKAVSLKPDDGYIVDSLGWALLSPGQLQGGGQASGARRGAAARGRHAQRSPRRRLLAGQARARGPVPVGAGPEPQAGARGGREDPAQAGAGTAIRQARHAKSKRSKQVQRPERAKKRTEVNPALPFFQ